MKKLLLDPFSVAIVLALAVIMALLVVVGLAVSRSGVGGASADGPRGTAPSAVRDEVRSVSASGPPLALGADLVDGTSEVVGRPTSSPNAGTDPPRVTETQAAATGNEQGLLSAGAAPEPSRPAAASEHASSSTGTGSFDAKLRLHVAANSRPNSNRRQNAPAEGEAANPSAGAVSADPASAPRPPISPQPDDASPPLDEPPDAVRVYCWQPAPDAGLRPAVLLNRHGAPAAVIQQVEAVFKDLPVEERCLMIAPWQIYQGPPFEKSKLLQIVRHGPDLSADRNWWGQVLWGLEQRGLRPGRVALDWETGVGYWDLRGPNQGDVTLQLAPVWQDAEAFARLPEAVRVYEPAEFDWKTNRHAVIAWTQYAAEVRADALREVFVEPLHAVFPGVPVSNYRDARHSGALKDSNGWPFPQAGVGLESSPPLYRKSAEENLQMLRAVADAGGPPPVPWVSYPSYVGRDVWEATIRGAYALGVREFLYWNPAEEDKAQGDDTFAAGIFRLLRVAEGAAFD